APSAKAPIYAADAAPASQPAAAPTSQPAGTLASGVYTWENLKVKQSAFGEQRAGFRSPTPTLDELEMHITTVHPGQRSHQPHRHPHEEMMFLKEGTLEATINDQKFPMTTGSVLFVAPNDLHGLVNNGTTDAT